MDTKTLTTVDLLAALESGAVDFSLVIDHIDRLYQFTPTAFRNGEQYNTAGSNNGSCKIFAFARLHDLSEQATLHAFGDYYTRDVLQNAAGSDHGNIRNFITHGWAGVVFEGEPLARR